MSPLLYLVTRRSCKDHVNDSGKKAVSWILTNSFCMAMTLTTCRTTRQVDHPTLPFHVAGNILAMLGGLAQSLSETEIPQVDGHRFLSSRELPKFPLWTADTLPVQMIIANVS